MAILSRHKRAKPPKTEIVTKTPKTDCEVVTFARLDYWSMLDLFDRISVHDLVRLNGLASWWSGYVTKVCRTKRDITVRCGHKSKGSDDDTQDQFNLLKVTTIDSYTSYRLGQLLPNITSLVIIIDGRHPSDDIADITHLISQWSHQLVNLKIECQSEFAQVPEETENRQMQIKQLLLSLNIITSLRRLTIKCKWWKCSPMQDPIDLTILSELKYFYFKTGDNDFDILRQSLVRYAGPNHNLKQIELPSLWLLPENDLLSEPQLLSKLTMLKLYLDDLLTRDQWALLPNLTTVDLGYIQSRSEFMEAITGMQCLKLIRTLKMLVFHDFDFDQVLIDLPQLPSVTNLRLGIVANLFTNPYQTVKHLQLHIIFPNVEFVYLGYAPKCTTSSYRVAKWMANIWNKISFRMFKLRVRLAFG